jgi:predicted dehydrogenase
MKNADRRSFIRKTALAGLGIGLAGSAAGVSKGTEISKGTAITKATEKVEGAEVAKGKRIGMIGLDTGHSVAFTKALNDPLAGNRFGGYKVVAAYADGTDNIEAWKKRIPEFTEEVKRQGVEIMPSIDKMLEQVDVVLLTCIDGNKHLEQALPVLKAGKRLFIDKPFAGSLSDACAIVEAARHYDVPMFSSSSLRYIDGAKEIAGGKIGKVIGVNAYSPAPIEEHHPDLFWYGVHGVEILFTVMGTGCKSVKRIFTENTDVVVGIWEDDRIGCFRGIRQGKSGYGATVFGEDGIEVLDKYQGYNPLLEKITEFFDTGMVPVSADETLEIFAFMQAADESKIRGGDPIDIGAVMQEAKSHKP